MAWNISEKEAQRLLGIKVPKQNKYNAQKTKAFGIEFDSMFEANRYGELLMLQKAGEITELKVQVPFVLIPEKREPAMVGKRGGLHKGKLIERGITYVADFVYKDKHGNKVVEDTKSKATKTQAYRLKKKLMLHVHNIHIKELTNGN